jgi:hypothetical protein
MAKVEFTKMMALETLAKIDAVKADKRLANFVAHEMELLAKKKSNKPSKRQEENEKVLVPAIKAFLATVDKATASQIANGVATDTGLEVTAPRVTAQLTKLKKASEVVNTKEKGVSYYSIAE